MNGAGRVFCWAAQLGSLKLGLPLLTARATKPSQQVGLRVPSGVAASEGRALSHCHELSSDARSDLGNWASPTLHLRGPRLRASAPSRLRASAHAVLSKANLSKRTSLAKQFYDGS